MSEENCGCVKTHKNVLQQSSSENNILIPIQKEPVVLQLNVHRTKHHTNECCICQKSLNSNKNKQNSNIRSANNKENTNTKTNPITTQEGNQNIESKLNNYMNMNNSRFESMFQAILEIKKSLFEIKEELKNRPYYNKLENTTQNITPLLASRRISLDKNSKDSYITKTAEENRRSSEILLAKIKAENDSRRSSYSKSSFSNSYTSKTSGKSGQKDQKAINEKREINSILVGMNAGNEKNKNISLNYTDSIDSKHTTSSDKEKLSEQDELTSLGKVSTKSNISNKEKIKMEQIAENTSDESDKQDEISVIEAEPMQRMKPILIDTEKNGSSIKSDDTIQTNNDSNKNSLGNDGNITDRENASNANTETISDLQNTGNKKNDNKDHTAALNISSEYINSRINLLRKMSAETKRTSQQLAPYIYPAPIAYNMPTYHNSIEENKKPNADITELKVASLENGKIKMEKISDIKAKENSKNHLNVARLDNGKIKLEKLSDINKDATNKKSCCGNVNAYAVNNNLLKSNLTSRACGTVAKPIVGRKIPKQCLCAEYLKQRAEYLSLLSKKL